MYAALYLWKQRFYDLPLAKSDRALTKQSGVEAYYHYTTTSIVQIYVTESSLKFICKHSKPSYPTS